jgi:hypothetical protein
MIEVDHERKVSIVTLSGEFDPVGVQAVVQAVKAHPDYDPNYNALYDLRTATMGSVTADQLQRLAYDVFDPSWTGTKFAMVAHDDDVFGMARVYAAVADGTVDQQRRAFRSYDDALEWLTD